MPTKWGMPPLHPLGLPWLLHPASNITHWPTHIHAEQLVELRTCAGFNCVVAAVVRTWCRFVHQEFISA